MKLSTQTDLKSFADAPYLTETRLADFITNAFHETQQSTKRFIFDKAIPNSGLRTRPDVYDTHTKRIWEFDGDSHYTKAATQNRDKLKDNVYASVLGMKVMHIPYFVQLTDTNTSNMVDLNWLPEYRYDFPHGFISKKCTLPADFNTLGIERFKTELKYLHTLKARGGSNVSIATEILQSMWLRESSYGEHESEVFFDVSWKYNGEFDFPSDNRCTSYILDRS